MMRTPCSDENGLKKGRWTPEEDWKLIAYVTRYGHWNWSLLPKFAGLERCGKSCRLRWLNYLRPNIKLGNYTQEEEETIIEQLQQGKRWCAIAAQLPGRSDNEIKNYWHYHLKKRFQHIKFTHEKSQGSKSKDHTPVEPTTSNNGNNITGSFQSTEAASQTIMINSCKSSAPSSSSEFSVTTDHNAAASNEKLIPEDEFPNSLDAYQENASESFWLEPCVAGIVPHAPSEMLVAEPECLSPLSDVELWSHDN